MRMKKNKQQHTNIKIGSSDMTIKNDCSVRLCLQLFVGGSMCCLFVFTSSCLWEEAKHVLFVRLYLQLFVGGSMCCLFVFTSSCLWEEACLVCVICVCLRIVVSSTFCVVFLLCFPSSYVPYVAGFSGLSLSIATSIFSNVYSTTKMEVRSTHAVIIPLSTICVY